MPLPIEGLRILIRDWTFDEHTDVLNYATDNEVVRFLPWGPHESPEDVDVFFERTREQQKEVPRRFYECAVEWRETGEVIGGIGLRMRDSENRQGEIGYAFRRDYWGKGIATEAAELMLDFGFAEFGLHRITAGVDTENVASQRVLEKAGMRREAHFRQDTLRRGEWRDSFIFAILEEEWRAWRRS